MSKIALTPNASGTGVFTISSPATNTNRTLTLPDEAGTVLTSATAGVPIGGPAFSAYLSVDQTVTASTNTKIQFNTELFDTNSCYDNTTNYRFTPTVAGYYQVCVSLSTTPATTATVINIYKNGSVVQTFITQANNGITCVWNLSHLVYLNGSTDYLEFYGQSNVGTAFVGGLSNSAVQAAMLRSAT